jgi:5-formyltetrahydrofolate cyclo-ligase
MTKAEIRAQIARTKKFHALEALSTATLKNLQGLEIYRRAKAVGCYIPLPDEVDVAPLFHPPAPAGSGAERTLEKVFYIPAFDGTAGIYRMAKYTPELKKGKFGIPEPQHPVWAGPDELDLILVPGVAFDRAGNRLGRGGGFYDRLLPQYRAKRAGICFDVQCLEEIPAEPHDCRMDLLVTESAILKFAMNS